MRGQWKVIRYQFYSGERLLTTYHRWYWTAQLAAFLSGPFVDAFVFRA